MSTHALRRPDWLNLDEDALDHAVRRLVARDADVRRTREDAETALGEVRRRLRGDSFAIEVLDHAVGLLDAVAERAAVAAVERVVRDVRGGRQTAAVGGVPHLPRETPCSDARSPALDASVVADPARLGSAIELILQADDDLRTCHVEAARLARVVRAQIPEGVWRDTVLPWEAALGDRASLAQELLVWWAYAEGERSGAARAAVRPR